MPDFCRCYILPDAAATRYAAATRLCYDMRASDERRGALQRAVALMPIAPPPYTSPRLMIFYAAMPHVANAAPHSFLGALRTDNTAILRHAMMISPL